MYRVGSKIINYIKKIDKKTIAIALTIAITIAYYLNPLDNVDITEWNRTFCTAVLSGISIDARIGNFYKLFFLHIPLTVVVLLIILTTVFVLRPAYGEFFSKFCILSVFSTVVSYISRYSFDASSVNSNPMLQCILAFFVILTIIAFLDRKEKFNFGDIVMFFLTFVILVMSCSLLFHAEKMIIYIAAIGVAIVGVVSVILYVPFKEEVYHCYKNFMFIMMWLPAIIRAALEGIYFLTEKGRGIERYYTHICRTSFAFMVLALLIIWFVRKRALCLTTLGYLGAIVSFSAISFFAYSYQYTFSYFNFANVYELGNNAVALDTYLYGKFPIIDYFSAHALGDVWTNLVYCFIHRDINGILVNPYGGLTTLIGLMVLFFIVKKIFDENIAILYVLMFPGMVAGIKWTSLCYISVALLLYICRKPTIKSYMIFWMCVLLSAFTSYDEGISLGVACILAYSIWCLLQKRWNLLKQFIMCGGVVGIVTSFLYFVYAIINRVPVIDRTKEWISVSVGSSSSWATSDFGDPTSFAFLVSYFVVPMTAIILMVFVLVKYIRNRKHLTLMILTVAFSLAQILYITRTIVYHNLATCSGMTGVLLNFIHWTVSAYVLYIVAERGENAKLLAFLGAMMAVMLVEETAVTHHWSSADSVLLNKGLKSAEMWDLQDDVTYNEGQERIIYDEDTAFMVNQFKNVFDTLLTDNQTFLDFANVTSMYLLTGRQRPCYVGQSPSLLTDLYSQECFLKEISEYDCPLAIVGTTSTGYLQSMTGIPHNVRYYKIAEYIYNNYRPLITFGEFAIWCEKEFYDVYREILTTNNFADEGYALVDYGYDFTIPYVDENGTVQFLYKPYHSCDFGQVPYIWANYDDYQAIDNTVIEEIQAMDTNQYLFEGSQEVVNEQGNYLAFEMRNSSKENISINIILYDSANEGARTQYWFTVMPGTYQYLIRVSEDYFWDIYNVDTILFGSNDSLTVGNVRILEGD